MDTAEAVSADKDNTSPSRTESTFTSVNLSPSNPVSTYDSLGDKPSNPVSAYNSLGAQPVLPGLAAADPTQYKHLKLVKRGFSGKSRPMVCGLSFESLPAWFWALRLSDWEAIVVLDTDEVRLRQYYNTTWAQVAEKLRIVTSADSLANTELVDVWFISGSRSFLDNYSGSVGVPMIFWVEKCVRRRPADTPTRTWFSVSHESVGGSTSARGVFGRSGMPELIMEVDPIRRSISHFMKFSIRPIPCRMSCNERHYLLSQRLVVSAAPPPTGGLRVLLFTHRVGKTRVNGCGIRPSLRFALVY